MEKRICGKLPEKVAKIDLPEVKSDIEDWIKNKRETGGKFEVDPKKLERAFEALKQAGISEDYLKLLKGSGIDDLAVLNKYKNWLVDPDYRKHIESIAKKRGLTLVEAHLIHGYTNDIFIKKMNSFLRGELKDLPQNEKKAIEQLINTFDRGLDKMPDVNGQMVLRGDSWSGWNIPEGSEIDLHGYTSCARNKNDIFLGKDFEGNNLLIEIEVIKGRAKDITELAFFPNFAKKIGKTPTTNEALILRDSRVKVIKLEEGHKFEAGDGSIQNVTKISTQQTK